MQQGAGSSSCCGDGGGRAREGVAMQAPMAEQGMRAVARVEPRGRMAREDLGHATPPRWHAGDAKRSCCSVKRPLRLALHPARPARLPVDWRSPSTSQRSRARSGAPRPRASPTREPRWTPAEDATSRPAKAVERSAPWRGTAASVLVRRLRRRNAAVGWQRDGAARRGRERETRARPGAVSRPSPAPPAVLAPPAP